MAFAVQHVKRTPAGWKVRSRRSGKHVLRIAFPPGRRRRGSGQLVEVLHPKKENGKCAVREKAARNPAELLIFGNPARRATPKGHKVNCACFACIAKRSTRNSRRQTKARTRRAAKNARPYRNPTETEQAVRLFETFHGKDPAGIVEKHVSAAMRKDYTGLGNLLYVKVKTPVGQLATFEFPERDGVMLASSPNGKQLYCIGGNQNLLPLLDDDSKQKDFLDLGECVEVAYLARKIHSDYDPIEWYHKFGEARDGSTKPQLMFDRLKKQLFFVGGEYWIDPNVDISPGIEN